MPIFTNNDPTYDITAIGFDKNLIKGGASADTPEMRNIFSAGTSPRSIITGELAANFGGDAVGYIDIGRRVITVNPGDDVQKSIDLLNEVGGGTLFFTNGTYYPSSSLTLYSNIQLIGETPNTTIDFEAQSRQVIITGSNAYATGTIAVTKNSQTITGTGTSWLTNVDVSKKIMIDGTLYNIQSVDSDTQITISVPYAGSNGSSLAYTIANYLALIKMSNLILQNSAMAAIKVQYTTNIQFKDMEIVKGSTANTGMTLTNSNLIMIENVKFKSLTESISVTDSHYITGRDILSINASSGNGFDLTDLSYSSFYNCTIHNSNVDGFNLDSSCKYVNIDNCRIFGNGGKGIDVGLDCAEIFVNGSVITSNGSDGIYSQGIYSFFTNNAISGNAGWGIQIASDSNRNSIQGNSFSDNTSGSISDSGTGNVIKDNIDAIIPPQEIQHFKMQNNSGAQRVAGEVVVFDAVAAGNGFTTTTTQGNDKVLGVVAETIASLAFGRVQTLGKITTLKVNGTAAIAIGDFLGTFTTAGIAMKASTGDMCFAIALEAYAVADSSGVIDALLVTPRLI